MLPVRLELPLLRTKQRPEGQEMLVTAAAAAQEIRQELGATEARVWSGVIQQVQAVEVADRKSAEAAPPEWEEVMGQGVEEQQVLGLASAVQEPMALLWSRTRLSLREYFVSRAGFGYAEEHACADMKQIIFILLGLAILIEGAFFLFTRTSISTIGVASPLSTTTPGVEIAPSTLQTRAAPTGAKEYASANYKLSLFYPQDLSVSEYTEKAGGHTISFDSADGKMGFQIFTVPYSQTQITQSRMMLDTHNSAKLPPQEIIVGGQHALLFSSTDPVYGPLKEVWFIHAGRLFEVTTYDDEADQLAAIVSTFIFF
jgi:hypothetical protein